MRRAVSVGLAALIVVAVVGCGSSGPSKQADAIAHTYDTHIEAVKKGDGRTACPLLTPAYRRRASTLVTPRAKQRLKGASCPRAISHGTLRAQLQQFRPNLERIQVNGNRASGFNPGQGPFGPQKVLFRRLGGGWKISGTIYQQSGPAG
jgi:hypothetical protein